ncbi:hypothetical protein [Polaromonas sp. CG9_12]|nr:hypothetical protein [Polaromonas sp. CG9_12]
MYFQLTFLFFSLGKKMAHIKGGAVMTSSRGVVSPKNPARK